jgi:hypothetical protein
VTGAERNLRFGWWALLAFLLVGLALEGLHGFKTSWYVSVAAEPRRLMWRLAHAHGTLLALVNVAFALTVRHHASAGPWIRRASPCLLSAAIVLPGGFFLGGFGIAGGDPGPGVLVVPVGALLLAAGVACTALGVCGGAAESAGPQVEKPARHRGGVS